MAYNLKYTGLEIDKRLASCNMTVQTIAERDSINTSLGKVALGQRVCVRNSGDGTPKIYSLQGIEWVEFKYQPTILEQNTTNRLVTDTQINAWNNKAEKDVATIEANGLMSTQDKVDLAESQSRLYVVGSIFYDYTAGADIDSGTISSSTANSITDATKNWVVGSFINKAVKLMTDDGEEEYCVILSNTTVTLTFDCDHSDLVLTSYRILDTFEVPNTMQAVISANITANDGALILPNVADIRERMSAKVYNELTLNGDHKLAIIFRGLDRGRGSKFVTLDHQYEGVDFYAHRLGINHWDLLNIENVKRYASFKTNADTTIALTNFAPILGFATTNHLLAKRFIPKNIDDNYWLKYKSVVPATFYMSGGAMLTKMESGLSTVEITVRVRRFDGGVIEDFTEILTTARLRENFNEITTIPLSVPFKLFPNDELTVIARTDVGVVTLDVGSSFIINES